MALQMNVRPEDKPKLIAIAVAIVGINVFVFSKVLKSGQPAQEAPAAASKTAPSASPAVQVANAQPAPSGQVAQSPSKSGDVQSLNLDESPPPPLSTDPFLPIPGTEPKEPSSQNAVAQAPAREVRRMTQGGAGVGIPVLPPMKVNVAAQATPELTAEITLKGTIEQERSMAIFKIGDKTLYLTEGEKLPGGGVLEKATAEGATVRIKGRRIHLVPGQTLKPSVSYLSATGETQNSF